MRPVLEVDALSLSVATATGRRPLLEDVALTLYPGQTLGLVGESGAGKTLLARSLLRLLPKEFVYDANAAVKFYDGPPKPNEGAAREQHQHDAVDLLQLDDAVLRSYRGRAVAFVAQEPKLAFDPLWRMGAQLDEALIVHKMGGSRAQRTERIVSTLQRVGIHDPQRILRQYPEQLSGGERQRVAIAMALLPEPKVLICDEPTASVDGQIQKTILENLQRIQKETGLAILWIGHDFGVMAALCHHIAVMYTGQIIEYGPLATVLAAPAHPYTRGLLQAVPQSWSVLPKALPGHAPAVGAWPPHCRFWARCTVRQSRCQAETPALGVARCAAESSTALQQVRCFFPLEAE